MKKNFNQTYEDPEFHEDTNKIVPLDAYAFEDGKTYMISINSDELLKINTIRTELEKVNPKIRWIVVPSSVKPIPNPNIAEALKNVEEEIDELYCGRGIGLRVKKEIKEILNKHFGFEPEEKK